MDALSLIRETFAPLSERSILDIGCGPGLLAAALAERGARVTGLDPGAAALRAAAGRVAEARFVRASAEALPFPAACFDGAVMLNALHHVPDPGAALAEAARVLRPGAALVVVEPLAEGSAFAALQPIEDETAVRAAAQVAIAATLAAGRFVRAHDVTFARREVFPGLGAFLERAACVDPARRAAIRDNAAAAAAAFAAAAEPVPEGYALVQPLRAQVLLPA